MMTIDPYTTSARRGIKLLSRILRRYQPRVARRLFAEHPFGGCPSCGGCDFNLNVFKNHFMLCDIHRIYWSFSWNLLSSWQFQTRLDWRANVEKLKAWSVVRQ